jgi:hypothetical protein
LELWRAVVLEEYWVLLELPGLCDFTMSDRGIPMVACVDNQSDRIKKRVVHNQASTSHAECTARYAAFLPC